MVVECTLKGGHDAVTNILLNNLKLSHNKAIYGGGIDATWMVEALMQW